MNDEESVLESHRKGSKLSEDVVRNSTDADNGVCELTCL